MESIRWGPNWDDNLAGTYERIDQDPLTAGIAEKVRSEYEQAFMFYLPRICEHCLNPSCVASCPSGAMYKREEDGIVLVDQAKCRGWRFCVSGCPYKKVYFNHRTIVNALESDGYEADPDAVFGAVDAMRIPVEYLANLLAAGDSEVISGVLRRLAAMRGHMRKREVLGEHDEAIAAAAGMTVQDVKDMYRLLAIGKYEDRYLIPKAHTKLAEWLLEQQGTCGIDFEGGPGNCGMISDPTPDYGRFMLTEEPVELDIIKIAQDHNQGAG